jgi:hypothetical protein
MPLGYAGDRELRRMRVLSSAPAPSTIAGALKSITSRVLASITRTPTALLVASPSSTSETIEYGRTVRWPESRAG